MKIMLRQKKRCLEKLYQRKPTKHENRRSIQNGKPKTRKRKSKIN